MGIYRNFIQVIHTLNNKLSSRLKINGHLSESITMQLSSRQGPLSPLPFSLYIEQLAQWLRQTQSINGIYLNGEDHNVELFADDVNSNVSIYM